MYCWCCVTLTSHPHCISTPVIEFEVPVKQQSDSADENQVIEEEEMATAEEEAETAPVKSAADDFEDEAVVEVGINNCSLCHAVIQTYNPYRL